MSPPKLKEIELVQSMSMSESKKYQLIGKSLYLFKPTNGLRLLCNKIVGYAYYDNIVLSLIGISTVMLAIDNPLYDQKGELVNKLNIIDNIMTILFTLECMINIILHGFLINGKSSYLNDSWNQLDFVIVVVAIISLAA